MNSPSRNSGNTGAAGEQATPAGLEAERRLVRACEAVVKASAEFGLSSGYCGEQLDELCTALDLLLGGGL